MFSVLPNCLRIVLGVSHDNGYARLLSKLQVESVVPGKVVLLEGPPFAAELTQFSTSIFPRIKFPNLFLEHKLGSVNEIKFAKVAADAILHVDRRTKSSGKPSSKSPAVVSSKKVQSDSGILFLIYLLM
jgi:hypothetical protein